MIYLSPSEFRELGFLQELNRQFLHPRGLALEVTVDTDTGDVALGGIQDHRADPEGVVYADEVLHTADAWQKAQLVSQALIEKIPAREAAFGAVIQPVRSV